MVRHRASRSTRQQGSSPGCPRQPARLRTRGQTRYWSLWAVRPPHIPERVRTASEHGHEALLQSAYGGGASAPGLSLTRYAGQQSLHAPSAAAASGEPVAVAVACHPLLLATLLRRVDEQADSVSQRHPRPDPAVGQGLPPWGSLGPSRRSLPSGGFRCIVPTVLVGWGTVVGLWRGVGGLRPAPVSV